jgi:hypothetical protein
MGEQGFVYVLNSPNCPAIKIGGTRVGPTPRLRGINAAGHYVAAGPWTIVDFLQVTDWRTVERNLHSQFAETRFVGESGASELFTISVNEAREALLLVDETYVVQRDKLDVLFERSDVFYLCQSLFRISGIGNWVEHQGGWTFSLFPSTSGGRIFTLSIRNHEVAYATLEGADGKVEIAVVVDRLISDYPESIAWLESAGGGVDCATYATQLDRAVVVWAKLPLQQAHHILGLKGLRRAMTAYWSEALILMSERQSRSLFARHHNYNAVAALVRSNLT